MEFEKTNRVRQVITKLLNASDMVIGGSRSWDITINDDRVFARILRSGGLGAGESYVDGWWDCEALDQLAVRVLSADLLSKVERSLELWLTVVGTKLLNRQRGERGHAVAAVHYDLGNDLFAAMLGPTMNYSCGYSLGAADLDEAQEHKMDLICRKLQLTPDDHLLVCRF